ncbi:MAG: trk system potassium uptake protein TrkA [Candidatus Magnetoglobus multicellularis str. Araruama]|uniref:Trk system potassium uptake protein TrkA n=1 Tax=Candidatus Magnetoglobus multicellularis str. Araruama TaxID=890399 RepID=A0A1V1P959_9BACT|nr:MAG: trk system potassium uptake protein TrkA [Candidatus Magnetoglobus multicellularis str. Araruama]
MIHLTRSNTVKVVIIGAGEVGFHIASRIAYEQKEVVVIDNNESALQRVSESIDVQVIKGSGSSPSVLKEAGIEDAKVVLAVTDSDQINMVACLFSDYISPKTMKLVRLRNPDYISYKKALQKHSPHIHTIINPDIEAVRAIERFMSVPGAVDVGDFADGRIQLIGFRLTMGSPLLGIRLMDMPRMENGGNILIAAVIRKEMLIIPRGKDVLAEGDLVYIVCESRYLTETLRLLKVDTTPVRRVMIIGGGRVGYKMAAALEKKSIKTKLIEKDPKVCQTLAEKLNRVMVLKGDGTDQNLLIEENVQNMDMVITLTGDEETNILSSLLARRMGARSNITRISKFSYFPLVEAIGIDHIVSPRLSAVNTILQHIREGNVLSAISIKGEQAEVMEAIVQHDSNVAGKTLQKIPFPKGALVVGVVRKEDTFIPTGSTVIQTDDRIIIFAVREVISKIEKIMTVKLKYY